MEIICAQCNATYNIPDHKLPRQKAAAQCRKCGGRIVVAPRLTAPAEVPRVKASVPTPTPPAPTPQAAPQASGAAAPRRHDPAILEGLPGAAEFSPAQFALGEILRPTRKGRWGTRANRFKLKILTAVRPVAARLLRPGEQVLRVAAATAYHPVEIFLGNGVLTMLYNRYALLATNQRLLMINTNHRLTRPAHYLFQMGYAEIKKLSRGLFRSSLALTRKAGRRRIFISMKRAHSAEMGEFISGRLDPQATAPVAQERICPACFAPQAEGRDRCPTCQAAFKTPRRAALRSLLLPGWGDIYLGHRVLGALELLGSMLIWALLVSELAAGGDGVPVFAALLAVYNLMDGLLTRHMAGKGYSLEKEASAPAPATGLAAART